MKRLLIAVLILLTGAGQCLAFGVAMSVGGGVAATVPQSFGTPVCATGSYGSSPQTVQLTGVSAGDLIAVWTNFFSEACNVSVSDGTSSFTSATRYGAGPYGQFAYLLASTATGTVTYTSTCAGANMVVQACRVTPSVAVSLDGTATGAYASSNAPSSGNITTTGSPNIIFGGVTDFDGGVISSPTINGAAADVSSKQASNYGYIMVSGQTSGVTGAAACSINQTNNWVAAVIGFK